MSDAPWTRVWPQGTRALIAVEQPLSNLPASENNEGQHLMAFLETGVQGEETPLELLRERDALSRALLSASARLATAQDPDAIIDRKSTRLNSSHMSESRMPSSA